MRLRFCYILMGLLGLTSCLGSSPSTEDPPSPNNTNLPQEFHPLDQPLALKPGTISAKDENLPPSTFQFFQTTATLGGGGPMTDYPSTAVIFTLSKNHTGPVILHLGGHVKGDTAKHFTGSFKINKEEFSTHDFQGIAHAKFNPVQYKTGTDYKTLWLKEKNCTWQGNQTFDDFAKQELVITSAWVEPASN